MRFGVTVEECVPVDLGDSVDFAQILLARAAAQRTCAAGGSCHLCLRLEPLSDARALRRLFLELPCVMCALRLAVLPPGQELFRRHQDLLRASTWPACRWRPCRRWNWPPPACRSMRTSRRAGSSTAGARSRRSTRRGRCCRACRLAADARLEPLFDDAERIVANLEYDIGERRLALAESEPA